MSQEQGAHPNDVQSLAGDGIYSEHIPGQILRSAS